MGKLKNELEMGGVPGGWTQPCLLPMAMGHHSLVGSQFLHLHAPASEATGSLERAKTWCLVAFHNLHTHPWQSPLQWNKDKIKAVRVQPPLCNSFLYFRLRFPLLVGVMVAIMLFLYSVTCDVVSLEKQNNNSHTKKQPRFKSIHGTESHFVVGEGGVWKQWLEWSNLETALTGNWNYLSSTYSVPETVMNSLHVISVSITVSLWNAYHCYPRFTGKEPEAQSDSVTVLTQR